MTDISFIRGNIVIFNTTFSDSNGDPVDPASATVTIVTAPIGLPSQTIMLSMTKSGSSWSAQWDTTGIPGGLVFWAAKAQNPSGADEGSFTLLTNAANQ